MDLYNVWGIEYILSQRLEKNVLEITLVTANYYKLLLLKTFQSYILTLRQNSM